MSKRMYEDLKEILCHELNDITRKGELNKESLDDVYKLSSAITMVESLMKRDKQQQGGMTDNNEEGYSQYMPMWRSYDGNNGMSNARGNMSNERGVTDGRDRSRDYRGSSNDYSRDNNSYEESHRRGRDARTGRYVSRDSYDSYDGSYDSYERGYSRHTAEQKVVEKLEDILETTQNSKIRNAIMQAMDKIER